MAKVINIPTTRIEGCQLNLNGSDMDIIVYGRMIDDSGDPVGGKRLELKFSSVSAGLQSDINGLMRELSENFNEVFADESSRTWVDL